MKKDLLDILCCPTCKGDLKLDIKKEEKGEILRVILLVKNAIAHIL